MPRPDYAPASRLEGRDGDIWTKYCRGMTMAALGREYGISEARVSQIIKRVRDAIPAPTRDEVVQEQVDAMREIRAHLLDMAFSSPPPLTAGKDGSVVRDPESGAVVRDVSGNIRAAETAGKFLAWEREMLGIDAPKGVQHGGEVHYKIQGVDLDALT